MIDDGGASGVPAVRFRLRVAYAKERRLAFLGHLEVIATLQRSVRRSGLPFAVGNGYARRMKVQFSQALPTGASSRCEYYDLLLTERVNPEVALAALREATPHDLAPYAAAYVSRRQGALESWLTRSRWEVELEAPGVCAEGVCAAVAELLSRRTLHFMRGDKPRAVDLPSTLVSWSFEQEGDDVARGVLDTRATGAGALRPGVLLAAVSAEDPSSLPPGYVLRVCRTGQWHEEDGRLVEALPRGIESPPARSTCGQTHRERTIP